MTFLQNVAAEIISKGGNHLVVAPNRRALVFLRDALGEKAVNTHFFTIEDFICGFSELRLASKVELIPILHQVYQQHVGFDGDVSELESLVDFFFWGDMLLKDFDLIDHYAQNPKIVFRDIAQLKELDDVFSALSEEQIQYLEKFWGDVEGKADNKSKFLYLWRKLYPVYEAFKSELLQAGIAYGGMLYHSVVKALQEGLLNAKVAQYKNRQIHFVGFNALTKTEEQVLSYFVANCMAKVSWDIDGLYVNSDYQQAGIFFREYQAHPVLGKTFPKRISSSIEGKKVHIISSATNIGQVQTVSELLKSNGGKPEQNLVVLADEKLLTPVMGAVAPHFDAINVTMGYSLSQTPLASLLELFFELALSKNDEGYYHKPLCSLLDHPYLQVLLGEQAVSVKEFIVENNWVRVPEIYLQSFGWFKELLEVEQVNELPFKAKTLLEVLSVQKAMSDLDKDYLLYFLDFLGKLSPVFERLRTFEGKMSNGTARSFIKLFRQLLNIEKIPFEGDPMRGVQVMGVLETRNLDFKNVYILSCNEGVFPQGASVGSYIPFSIRKAYGLPVNEHRDAMYAYLFYRLLQRSENVYLIYNSSKNALGQGELSRFAQQLTIEPGVEVVFGTQVSELGKIDSNAIEVSKTEEILNNIKSLLASGVSPSALNAYLECSLKFFFKYVLKYTEKNAIEEDLDARVLGNIMHRCMELMYGDSMKFTKDNTITKSMILSLKSNFDLYVDSAFRETYGIDGTKAVVYTGQRLVVKEIVKQFIDRILDIDLDHAPFQVEGLEQKGLKLELATTEGELCTVTGIIDRTDSKDGHVRIVDYKTGKDELNFKDIESLFERGSKRNKAAFQTLLYAFLYAASVKDAKGKPITSGLYNRANLFAENFVFGLTENGQLIEDAMQLKEKFIEQLKIVLSELTSKETTFNQTEDLQSCRYCEYAKICSRQNL